jgi:ankyrin repeat protein
MVGLLRDARGVPWVLSRVRGQRWRATALHQGANCGHLAFVALLLEHGANADVLDNEYQVTPADWAEYGRAEDLAAMLALLVPRMSPGSARTNRH